jgi:hypothetical protein
MATWTDKVWFTYVQDLLLHQNNKQKRMNAWTISVCSVRLPSHFVWSLTFSIPRTWFICVLWEYHGLFKILQWNTRLRNIFYSTNITNIPINSLSNSPLSYLKTTKQIKVGLKIFFFFYWFSITIFICAIPYISFKKWQKWNFLFKNEYLCITS